MKKLIAIILCLALITPTLADHCFNQAAVVQNTHHAVVPFAIPVAVPVATVSNHGVLYSYGGGNVEQLKKEIQELKALIHDQSGKVKATQQLPVKQSLLVQNCTKCHSGTNPKGDFTITDNMQLSDRMKMISAIVNQKMPPKKKLDGKVTGLLIQELSK